MENFRNRIIGEGATNWASVFNHPATHILLEMRNPQQDVCVLKFKAELTNRITGEVIPGLCTAGIFGDELEQGWTENISGGSETTALISLEGKKVQNFVLPIFIDYLKILEGDYNLRVTLSGNGQEKIQETPLTITQKHSMGLFSVGFAVFCVKSIAAPEQPVAVPSSKMFSGFLIKTINKSSLKLSSNMVGIPLSL